MFDLGLGVKWLAEKKASRHTTVLIIVIKNSAGPGVNALYLFSLSALMSKIS
jgi:hypothetical protein